MVCRFARFSMSAFHSQQLLVRAECLRCPWLQAETKVAANLGISPHIFFLLGVPLSLGVGVFWLCANIPRFSEPLRFRQVLKLTSQVERLFGIDLGLESGFFFWGAETEIAPFLSRCNGEKLWVQAKFLDVTQDKEGVLNLSIVNNLLKILVLYHIFVDLLLSLREGQPNDQVCFQRKFVQFERSSSSLSADNFENLVLRAPQEVSLVHFAELLA